MHRWWAILFAHVCVFCEGGLCACGMRMCGGGVVWHIHMCLYV